MQHPISAKDIPHLMKQSATLGSDISGKDQETARLIRGLGPDAIPFLLPLLKDNYKAFREFAAYILSDIDGLTEEHLDALMEYRLKGDGGISPAIARIGTKKAIEFLIDVIKKRQKNILICQMRN